MRSQEDHVLRLLDNTRELRQQHGGTVVRMVKLHDKISGSFRSVEGAQAFATVRSYIQTAALQGHNRLDVLRRLFSDGPWLPAAGASGAGRQL